jgi:hypothetical protein
MVNPCTALWLLEMEVPFCRLPCTPPLRIVSKLATVPWTHFHGMLSRCSRRHLKRNVTELDGLYSSKLPKESKPNLGCWIDLKTWSMVDRVRGRLIPLLALLQNASVLMGSDFCNRHLVTHFYSGSSVMSLNRPSLMCPSVTTVLDDITSSPVTTVTI